MALNESTFAYMQGKEGDMNDGLVEVVDVDFYGHQQQKTFSHRTQ